jgi:MerR family transcriptional regulator, light-induced transcriptional regulator
MDIPDPLLKTQPIAEALGVSVSTIKRWIDSGALPASRTAGKHRLVPFSEAVRFARRQGLPLEKLEEMGGGPLISLREGIGPEVCEVLVAALRTGDRKRARAIVFAAHESGCGAAAIADQLIRPVMERIGHGWAAGSLDVSQEHQGTQILAGALSAVNDVLSRSVLPAAPVAIGTAPAGDFYQLPILLGEMVLRELGWNVHSLGSNLPMSSLAGAVRRIRPSLVFVSVSHCQDEEQFVREFELVHESAKIVKAAVMLGGRAFNPELRARIVCAGFGDRMTHLAEFAKSLSPPSSGVSA